MEPLFFGEDQRQLYGVYHAAVKLRPRNEGVVLFYPTGQEYMRIHRAYRWLADRLAGDGFHVMRFDYSGQGDSAGTFEEARVEQWCQDGRAALDELEAISGCESIALIGTRLGATIASMVCDHPLAKRLVLWEPRSPGSTIVGEMQAQVDSGEWPLANFIDDEAVMHLNGFAFSPALLADIEDSCINPAQIQSIDSLLLLTSLKSLDTSSFMPGIAQLGVKTEERVVEGPTDWNRVDGIGGVFLPQRILHDISEWLGSDPK